jgi:hypothetical protein
MSMTSLPEPMADAFGALGVALYVVSYFALQAGFLRGNGYAYPAMNLLAAAAVLASLSNDFNLFAASIQAIWIAVSVVGIARLWAVRHFLTLDDAERGAALALVPGLAKNRARQFLHLGRWIDVAPGAVLATEGTQVGALGYVAEGRCRIDHRGVPVAAIGPGGMIGEMTYQTGAPATATVIAATPVRLLRIESGTLRDYLTRNEDVAEALERAVAGDLRRKLEATTRAMSAGGSGAD